jgi:hypothetical protein
LSAKMLWELLLVCERFPQLGVNVNCVSLWDRKRRRKWVRINETSDEINSSFDFQQFHYRFFRLIFFHFPFSPSSPCRLIYCKDFPIKYGEEVKFNKVQSLFHSFVFSCFNLNRKTFPIFQFLSHKFSLHF